MTEVLWYSMDLVRHVMGRLVQLVASRSHYCFLNVNTQEFMLWVPWVIEDEEKQNHDARGLWCGHCGASYGMLNVESGPPYMQQEALVC